MAGILGLLMSGAGLIKDQYFNLTTLLLPGNGTNGAQNNTFLDSSTNNFTITRNGNTTQGTFSPFSQTGWGNYFDGSGDYLTGPTNNAFNFGTGDFTIEAWVCLTAIPAADAGGDNFGAICAYTGGTVSGNQGFEFGLTTNLNNISFASWGSANAVECSLNAIIGTWYHIAVSRSSGTSRIFVNGNQQTLTKNALQTNTDADATIRVATSRGDAGFNHDFPGYISNLRIVKGQALYTGSFTPATSSLTAGAVGSTGAGVPTQTITGTVSLLTCQSNRFIDNGNGNSGSGFTLTVNGNPSVVAFSPFALTAVYTTTAVGGSGYFDGTGDYLSISSASALAVGASSFTLEAWVYFNSVASGGFGSVASSADAAGDRGVSLFLTGGGAWRFRIGRAVAGEFEDFIGTTTLVANQWYYFKLVRTSTGANDTRIYLNGNLEATGTSTISISKTSFVIGRVYPSGNSDYLTGYISSLRMTNTAESSSVPTAPTTAVSGTQLLLNFTNAGITDATAKNVLETAGNAQISTTQSKWGGSSISFDGTGDWLLIPDQPQQRIGTGNFTIEMWVYRNASGTYGLVGKGTGTTGWLVSLNSSNQVVFTYGSSTITSTGTVSATTWTYIAVVREGTGTNQTKIYINGTNDGTGTVNTDFNQTNSMYIGADRTGGSAANAYVQDVRITNYARTITASPTAPFPVQ